MDSFFICLFPVVPHFRTESSWSLFWMVMEKPITPVLKGCPIRGLWGSIPAPVRALLSTGLSQCPTESHLYLLFPSPIHLPWFCILALNPETNFIFFSWHFKAKPSFFWKLHTFSHLVLGKHKPFSPSQCYSCDYLSAQTLGFFPQQSFAVLMWSVGVWQCMKPLWQFL